MSKFIIEKAIPWGHPSSNIKIEVTAYLTGRGQPRGGGGPNPFVPYPVPRRFPKTEFEHKAKLTPLGLEEGGEIWFDTDATYALYESSKDVFGIAGVKNVPLPKYKGELHFRHIFKYHFKDSGDDTVIDGGDLVIEKPFKEDRGTPPNPAVVQFRFEWDKGDRNDPGKKGPHFARLIPTVVVLTTTTNYTSSTTTTAEGKVPIIGIGGGVSDTTGKERSDNHLNPEIPVGPFTVYFDVPRIEKLPLQKKGLKPVELQEELLSKAVGFGTGDDVPTQGFQGALQRHLEDLKNSALGGFLEAQTLELKVVGYASELGDDYDDPKKPKTRKFRGNQDLSEKRAQWVANKIRDSYGFKATPLGKGVPPDATPGSDRDKHRSAYVTIDKNKATELFTQANVRITWIPRKLPLWPY
jgi:outer membrane protein OmpA-like peptidoglycan-associated protein